MRSGRRSFIEDLILDHDHFAVPLGGVLIVYLLFSGYFFISMSEYVKILARKNQRHLIYRSVKTYYVAFYSAGICTANCSEFGALKIYFWQCEGE